MENRDHQKSRAGTGYTVINNMTEHKTSRKFIVAILVLPVIAVVYYAISNIGVKTKTVPKESAHSSVVFDIDPTGSFPNVEITAKSAIVYDALHNKIFYSKNSGDVMSLASLTKIMTSLIATETAPSYTLLTIKQNQLSEEGDIGLRPNEIWKLGDLSNFMLISSSNDAARAIALSIGNQPDSDSSQYENGNVKFLEMMNKKAIELNLNSFVFMNETGLDRNITMPGAIGSAKDVAKLVSYIIKKYPDLLSVTKYPDIKVTSNSNIEHYASNTNNGVSKYPYLLASKTGYTELAGGNLMVAIDRKEKGSPHPIVIVVLGSTLTDRFKDAEKLMGALENYLPMNRTTDSLVKPQ